MIDMNRTIGELKALIKDIPDDAHVWAYEGEVCGIIIEGEEKKAFFDNYCPGRDKKWGGHQRWKQNDSGHRLGMSQLRNMLHT